MAQKVTTTLIDDLDGSQAEETVRFGLDGTAYEIDLNAKNAAALRKALQRFIASARKAGTTRGAGKGAAGRKGARSGTGVDARAVRVWAKQNKITVQPRGRIPADVLERYRAASA